MRGRIANNILSIPPQIPPSNILGCLPTIDNFGGQATTDEVWQQLKKKEADYVPSISIFSFS